MLTAPKLVPRTARADTLAAADRLNSRALCRQTRDFSAAESGILRSRLSHSEVAVLDVCNPRTNCRCRIYIDWQWAATGPRRPCRHDLDHACGQGDASQWITRDISIDRERAEAIWSQKATAALSHFLITV